MSGKQKKQYFKEQRAFQAEIMQAKQDMQKRLKDFEDYREN